MNAKSTACTSTTTVPTVLESAQSKLVYLHLERVEETTVDALAGALGLRKLALFTVLSTLEIEGFVEREDARTVRFVA